MHRSDAALQRFYRLFYQWTILTCPPPVPRSMATRSLHSTTRLRDVGDATTRSAALETARGPSRSNSGLRTRTLRFGNAASSGAGSDGQATVIDQAPLTRRQRYRASTQSQIETRSTQWQERNRAGVLRSSMVKTPAERPFSELQAGDHVVRYKSDSSVMVELVVSGDHLQNLQKRYGQQFEKLNGRGRARVDLQTINRLLDVSKGKDPQNMLHSVLVTGTFDEVGVATDVVDKAIAPKTSIPKAWTYDSVQPGPSRPSSSLELGETVVRHRSDSSIVLEGAVSGTVIQTLERKYQRNLEELSRKRGAVIEVRRAEDGSLPKVTSVLISGSPASVLKVWHVCEGDGRSASGSARNSGASLTASTPLASVYRHDAENQAYIEVSLTERQWMRLAATSDVQSIAEKHNATVTIGEPKPRPREEGFYETEPARSICISGSNVAIESTHKAILSAVAKTHNHSALPKAHASSIAPVARSKAAFEDSILKMQTMRSPQTPDDVRVLMRTLTHPVVVITSSMQQRGTAQSDKWKELRGVTVSSFTTVALSPHPIVSFNLKIPSRSWDAMRFARRFRIHILAASAEGAAVADIFTRPHSDPANPFTELRSKSLCQVKNGLGAPPLIDGDTGGVLFSCFALLMEDKCVEVGDHVIVVAEILSTKVNRAYKQQAAEQLPSALAYGGRGFTQRGVEIKPGELPHFERRSFGLKRSEHSATDTAPDQPSNGALHHIAQQSQTSHDIASSTNMSITDSFQPHAKSLDNAETEEDLAEHFSSDEAFHSANSSDIEREASIKQNVAESEPQGDSLYEAMRALRDADRSGEDVDALQIMSGIDKAMKLDEPEDEHHHRASRRSTDSKRPEGFTPGRSNSSYHNRPIIWGADASIRKTFNSSSATQQNADHGEKDRIRERESQADPLSRGRTNKPLGASEDMSRTSSMQLTEKEALRLSPENHTPLSAPDSRSLASNIKLTAKPNAGAWGLSPAISRNYSTTTRPISPAPTFTRSYSTSKRSSANKDITGSSHRLDPAARHTVVADFLGLPDGTKRLPTHRIRAVVTLNRIAMEAKRRLEKEAEWLTEPEKLDLEHIFLVNDRIVSKKLAWNAASHLRVMLNKGRIDYRYAQFLESTIEKGQAVLLEEAKQIRELLDEGKIEFDRFQNMKAHLQKMNDVLITETNRLRQFVDDDGD